jgi:hypothetical protein
MAGIGEMSRLKHDEDFGEPSVTNICDSDSWSRVMIIIIGLVILVVAVVAGVLSNSGSGHALWSGQSPWPS